MGKTKKQKRTKEMGKSEKISPATQELSNPPSATSEKDKKKGNKKFGLALLRQAEESGWEGHELVRVRQVLNILGPCYKYMMYSCNDTHI
jgi:hypothetical protein